MTTVEHWPNGNIRRIEMRNENGELHNPNGPAKQEWYGNGRENYREYCVNNTYHNPTGPADQGWYENGQEQHKYYYVDGERHNPNGPARQEWYGDGRESYKHYWVNDKRLNEAEFKELQDSVEVTCGDKTVRIPKTQAVELGLIDKPKSTKN